MIQKPRGTRDFGPEEMEKRRHVEDIMRKTCDSFGFKEVMTPTFESTELFVKKSGPGIVDEIYAFKDKGGRDISLRPELTASVIRLYVEKYQNEPKPLTWYYFGPCYRYDRPQAGRYREFFQFGVEIIGASELNADVELISLALSILKNCGLNNFEVRIGHIGILRKLLSEAGLSEEEKSKALHLLDKKEYDGFRDYLGSLGIEEKWIGKAIEIVTAKMFSPAGIKKITGDFCQDEITYLQSLTNQIENLSTWIGFDAAKVNFDLGVVRGLDYYTGMVFEIDVPTLGAEKQVCGGGAYTLSEVFGGKPVPTTGFAIGFDRIVIAMENEGVEFPERRLDYHIIPIGEDARTRGYELLASIRNSGKSADMDMMGRNIKKALGYADKIGARCAIIIGEAELEKGTLMVKDLKSGEQKEIKREDFESMSQ